MKKVGNKEEIIEYGAYLIVAGSSVNQLRNRRQVILNYFNDMNVDISEASFDTPYLFQALLYGQDLQKKTRTWTHMVTARGFAELMPFTNTASGNRIGWYIGRVDNWTGRWDNLEEAIAASKILSSLIQPSEIKKILQENSPRTLTSLLLVPQVKENPILPK